MSRSCWVCGLGVLLVVVRRGKGQARRAIEVLEPHEHKTNGGACVAGGLAPPTQQLQPYEREIKRGPR